MREAGDLGPQSGGSARGWGLGRRGGPPHTHSLQNVFKHSQEDIFFASQFLNVLIPILVQHQPSIPKNFPITEAMDPCAGPARDRSAG